MDWIIDLMLILKVNDYKVSVDRIRARGGHGVQVMVCIGELIVGI